MNKLSLPAVIAIIIVSVFMIVSGLIAIFSYTEDVAGTSTDSVEPLKLYYSIFTTIIGMIIGYFFGKDNSK